MVARLLNGQAKATVVTGSRAAAVTYKLELTFIYTPWEVTQFGEGITRREPRQQKLFAITDPATERFNGRLKGLNDAIARYKQEFARCHAAGDAAGAEQADLRRSEYTTERDGLMRFKECLGKFVRVYEYIAQLIDFGDAERRRLPATPACCATGWRASTRRRSTSRAICRTPPPRRS